MVSGYKKDKSKPNPFEEPEIGMFLVPRHVTRPDILVAASVSSLRRDILQEETDAQKAGAIQLDETSPGTFLRRLLDIEEKQ